MNKILTDNRSNNSGFGFEPRDSRLQALEFQAHKGANSQPDVIALGDFEATLCTFYTSELLEATILGFDLPGIQSIESCFFNGHFQFAGCPAFSIAVCADIPEHLDPAILRLVLYLNFTRQLTIVVGPHQRNQIDSSHNLNMFARPV